MLFSHHAIPSLTADVPDELARPCTAADSHGHDVNPGCDLDPRDSAPIHLGADLTALLHAAPERDRVGRGPLAPEHGRALSEPVGHGGFWSIRVAAEADWPQQSRLLEIFDNKDGTLSIFGTILDHASPATARGRWHRRVDARLDGLASVGRTIAYNDPQYGGEACNPTCEGDADDRNVELLVADPREGGGPYEECGTVIAGTPDADKLKGTSASERIRGKRGQRPAERPRR